jgi:hypothetical protein
MLSCVLATVVAVHAASVGLAQTASAKALQLDANAALYYWRAFAILPDLKEKQQNALDAALKLKPVEKELGEAALLAEPALKELYRAASRPECVWGTPFEDGYAVVMPHLGKARALARAAVGRARWNFYSGKPADGTRDLIATVALARNVTADSTIISLLVGYAIEGLAEDVAVVDFDRMSPDELNLFAEKISRLPPAISMRDAILKERELFIDPVIHILSTPGGKENMLKVLDGSGESLNAIRNLSSKQLLEGVIALRSFYEKLAALCELPPSEIADAEKQLLANSDLKEPGRAWARLLMPTIGLAMQAEAKAKLRLALLKAAIAVRQHGPETLANTAYHDPFAKTPFSYEKSNGGFRLQSKTLDPKTGRTMTLETGKGFGK